MKPHRPGRGDAADVTQVSPLLSTAQEPGVAAEPLPGVVRSEAMVWVPGDEAHGVAGFWIDRFPVTNAAFARFVEATGHVTVAERERISLVFHPPRRLTLGRRGPRGWAPTPGADWQHPRGPRTSLRALGGHPVVHLAWSDVVAYAGWAGLAVPTEAEWACAARGLDGTDHPSGHEPEPGALRRTNSWQGEFPGDQRGPDGHSHTSPLQAFPANGLGVYDAIGNVWEWTADAPPAGPADSADPAPCHPRAEELVELATLVEPPDGDGAPLPRFDTDVNIGFRVVKGGSFLCGPGHCTHLRPTARVVMPTGISAGHIGFRCVARAPRAPRAAQAPRADRLDGVAPVTLEG